MLFALIDSCIIAVLAGVSAFQSDHPVLLLLAAGLLLMAVTAHTMGIRLTWLKWILAACFGVLSGVWYGYAVFAVLWPKEDAETEAPKDVKGEQETRRLLGLWFWLPSIAAMLSTAAFSATSAVG